MAIYRHSCDINTMGWRTHAMDQSRNSARWNATGVFVADGIHLSDTKCFDGLVQDCSSRSAIAMELLQPCTQPSVLGIIHVIYIIIILYTISYMYFEYAVCEFCPTFPQFFRLRKYFHLKHNPYHTLGVIVCIHVSRHILSCSLTVALAQQTFQMLTLLQKYLHCQSQYSKTWDSKCPALIAQ